MAQLLALPTFAELECEANMPQHGSLQKIRGPRMDLK